MKNVQDAKVPTVSVVIACYNSARTITRCLESIRTQRYPQEKIDIIIADGGSKDATRTIAKKYNVTWISIDPKKQNAEYNKSVGIARARGDILFLVDHDNVLPHPLVLSHAIQPFMEHEEVVGVETLRYHYDSSASLLDRYFALFGAGDPLAWYLGKADRLSYIWDEYRLAGVAKDQGPYYLVQFDPLHIPTLGANGFLIRRKLLLSEAQTTQGKFFHIDVNVDLIRKGYATYAFTKDSILHLTGYNSIWHFLWRRMLFVEQYHLGGSGIAKRSARRYSVYEPPQDTPRLIWFICISLTLVVPLWDSMRGFKKIQDFAWFLHPIMCFGLVVLYGWVIIKHTVTHYGKQLLGR